MSKPKTPKTIGSVHAPFSLRDNPDYVQELEKEIAEQQATIKDLA